MVHPNDRSRRFRKLHHLVAASLLVALPAAAQTVPEGVTRTYECQGGRVVQAAYLNPPAGGSYAVVEFDGRLIPMKAGRAGSGVRYVSLGEPRALVWHTKGNEAFLARDTDMSMLAEDCIARQP